ncbi:MAG: DNA mismatch repair protein MutS [Parachlamydiaceae bacterium]
MTEQTIDRSLSSAIPTPLEEQKTTPLEEQKTTPMMVQWTECKAASKGALLFFRMGDFYEAFYDDAVNISKELELTLTKRQEIPMCGVPHHTCEGYIDRLVGKGYRVAVAEQTEDPKQAKGLVRREVVRVVTPGTLINSSLLSDKANNFVASISRVGKLYGLAVLDLTTADFKVMEMETEQELLNEIHRLQPSEFVVSPKIQEKLHSFFTDLRKTYNLVISTHDEWRFDHQAAHDFLMGHFKVKTLDGYGLQGMVSAINAAGGLLSYLQDILCLPLSHINEIHTCSTSHYMTIDRTTQRHLELTESLADGTKRNTLLSILDDTKTPMGARLLRQWIKQPLLDPAAIATRQDAVESFYNHSLVVQEISTLLDGVRDMERLIMRISSGYASPRDLVALKNSFTPIPHIKEALLVVKADSELLFSDEQNLESLPSMVAAIETAVVDDPPMRVSDGKIFRDGYNRELDELRHISRDSKAWLARYQSDLKESTGIKTLKVGFNKMFGYYIEVSKGQSDRMPDWFQRRQTLVNAERYITPELKEYESKVLHAEEKISAIENELFHTLRLEVASYAQQIQRTAQALGRIDVIQSLASAARKNHYTRPLVDNSAILHITSGRHPVIETSQARELFIPNDTTLDDNNNRLLLITGPNMAGKSTFIRQVALITIMAQIGSFVPASNACIGVVDKVFSRIGASDDLSRGHSTFMVEMVETANILNNATSRSLVILDEIGRGTSTYDGISIAWSVAEYLLTTEGRMAKTLFATHYWELTKLEEKIPGAVNYNVAVHESDDNIIFLRKIVRGGTDKSYGIHVARLAGLPPTALARAREILIHLEENANRKSAFEPTLTKRSPARQKPKIIVNNIQMTFFDNT